MQGRSDCADWRKNAAPDRAIRERRSYGVACSRLSKAGSGAPPHYEILLICKRYTYSYNTFIHGRYDANNSEALVELFGGMTVDEKLDILSFNFMQIWYRVWLNNPHRTVSYFVSKNKFESAFLVDSGARLRRLISRAGHSDKIWEIPKGRKKNKLELDIHCAIREFHEETGVPKAKYRIFPENTRTHSYVDDNIRYTNLYYLAFAPHNIQLTVDFALQDQVDEICDIRWASLEDIRVLDKTGKLSAVVKPMFNFMKLRA